MTEADKSAWLAELFRFELCEVCMGDEHAHECGPDPLGLPHAYCKTAPEDA